MDERSSDKMAAKWMRQKRGPVGSLGVMGVGSPLFQSTMYTRLLVSSK